MKQVGTPAITGCGLAAQIENPQRLRLLFLHKGAIGVCPCIALAVGNDAAHIRITQPLQSALPQNTGANAIGVAIVQCHAARITRHVLQKGRKSVACGFEIV